MRDKDWLADLIDLILSEGGDMFEWLKKNNETFDSPNWILVLTAIAFIGLIALVAHIG